MADWAAKRNAPVISALEAGRLVSTATTRLAEKEADAVVDLVSPLTGPGQHNVVVLTPRLRLRAATIEDAETHHKNRIAPGMSKYQPYDDDITLEQTVSWLRRSTTKPGKLGFMIELRDDPDTSPFAEDAILSMSPYPPERKSAPIGGILAVNPAPFLGYSIVVQHKGQGLATEALRGFLTAYFAKWPDGNPHAAEDVRTSALASVHKEHVASGRVLTKAGFKKREVIDGPDEDLETHASWIIEKKDFEDIMKARKAAREAGRSS